MTHESYHPDTHHATSIPAWASAIISNPPPRGGGLNRWMLRAAIALRRSGVSEREIADALAAATAGEPIKRGEIERAVERSRQYMTADGTRPTRPPSRWPAFDPAARQRIIDAAGGYGAADLFHDSPWRFDDDTPATELIVDRLFPNNPLICAGTTLWGAETKPREEWRGKLCQQQFVVPSAMSKPTGINLEGDPTPRCLDNTGQRQFLIAEQDQGTMDEQAAIVHRLAQTAPLVLAVRSGNKSIHAWFRCRGASDDRQHQFFTQAVRLGADRNVWPRCQMVRMPDGWRPDRQARQSVLFFAPEAI